MRKAVARCWYGAGGGIYKCATMSKMPKGGDQRQSVAVLFTVLLVNETFDAFRTAESANSDGGGGDKVPGHCLRRPWGCLIGLR